MSNLEKLIDIKDKKIAKLKKQLQIAIDGKTNLRWVQRDWVNIQDGDLISYQFGPHCSVVWRAEE